MKYALKTDPFSRAFLENRNKTMEERIALGMREAALYQPISFPENCMLPTVGVCSVNGAVWFDYGGGISVDAGRYDTLIEENPADANQLQEIRDQMMDFHTQLRFLRSCPETDQKLWDAKACWGGTWGGHANPDYDRLLHWGTNGIR
ncbi:MAG: hypothetical protein II979_08185, partial [Clostridia bacterium]|nr:hypothetical protein [Clostridia bacterium]